MMKRSFYRLMHEAGKQSLSFRFLLLMLFCGALMPAGCTHVTLQQQRLVSKPNMQFSGSAIFSYQDRLLSQFESGSASAVGGQSAECGSCAAGGG